MLRKWLDKMYGDEIELRERLFRIIITVGVFAFVIALIASVFLHSPWNMVAPYFAGLISLLIFLWVSYRYHRIELSTSIIVIVIFMVMLPYIFFISGGVESGSSVWLVLAIIFIFLLCTGKKFFVFLTLTVLEYMALYYIAYKNPDLIIPMNSLSDVYLDVAIAVFVVGVGIGILIKFQIMVFTKEKNLSDRQRDQIEEISRSKSAFFANMSHEIRTPINTIIGLNEMILRDDSISEEVAENAVHIQNASKMLLTLINDILDLSKIESGRMEIVPTQYETGAMFSDLVNIVWVRAHEKGLEFRINISEEIPSMLYGDEVRIKQVLVNILTNAVKYTKTGSVTLSAKSEKVDSNRIKLRISVIDTGMGIRKESMEDLFASFKRVDEEKNRKIEGTGLGLSISKQLIELMGGKITVDSIYTKGSTFTVTVEQQIVNEKPIGAMDFMLKNKVYNREKYKQSFEAPEARVLVVDDNEMNLMVAAKLLRETKVQIDTAKSGMECLEKTCSRQYNVIFMDHKMPDMDGIETLAAVQTQENGMCQRVPVIALTANAITGAEDLYQSYGFQGYLAKPINGALFEATLLKFLPEEMVEYVADELEPILEQPKNTIQMVSGKNKKPISITTDCVCDLPQEWLERFDVKSMYYYVVTDQGHFCDVKEISSGNLLEYLMDENNHARSECASVQEYENFFADALEESERVIHISMAKRASGGYESAEFASRGFDNVTVVDSGHLSSGMGLMVLSAAQMAQDGCFAEEILTKLERLRELVSTSFIVPAPDTLYRNGKIGKATRDICNMLELRPILTLSQSRIRCVKMETGRQERAYRKYIKSQLKHKKKIDKRILFITTAGCSLKQQAQFKKEVEKYVKFERIVFQKASATISSNCGLGAFGLLFMRKE